MSDKPIFETRDLELPQDRYQDPLLLNTDIVTLNVIHCGQQFDPALWKPIKNRPYMSKPSGGLYTSPRNSKYDWLDWCVHNSFRYYTKEFRHDLEIHVDRNKLLIVDEDMSIFDKFILCQPEIPQSDLVKCAFTRSTIDYESMAKEYDVIWLTYNGLLKFGSCDSIYRYPIPFDFYGWDCETVLILNNIIMENIETKKDVLSKLKEQSVGLIPLVIENANRNDLLYLNPVFIYKFAEQLKIASPMHFSDIDTDSYEKILDTIISGECYNLRFRKPHPIYTNSWCEVMADIKNRSMPELFFVYHEHFLVSPAINENKEESETKDENVVSNNNWINFEPGAIVEIIESMRNVTIKNLWEISQLFVEYDDQAVNNYMTALQNISDKPIVVLRNELGFDNDSICTCGLPDSSSMFIHKSHLQFKKMVKKSAENCANNFTYGLEDVVVWDPKHITTNLVCPHCKESHVINITID